ncbi:MAG: DNA repair protein RadC [Oscillospiraceae bacterium]|nr:DNA repair protein RadC [Oscillospiraceae bacterium]
MSEDRDVHKGHRKRMLKRYIENGINSFQEHEILEVLLYQIIPRINTNDIAHNLINHFGSLKNVLLAPADELAKVNGIGDKSALQLNFIGDLANYLNEAKIAARVVLDSTRKIINYCRNHFKDKTHEMLTLLLLDDKCALLHICDTSSSQPNHIQINYREIVKQIIKYDAYKLIFAHNHIIGSVHPSDDDLKFTRRFCEYMNVFGVGLVEHIIVSGDDALSMRDSGYLSDLWDT